jgi:hypothetical protein
MIAVLVLLALVALRVVLVFGFALVLIPSGRVCPACGGETLALERTGLVRLLPGVCRRWCMACGWSWYRKSSRVSPVAPTARSGAMRSSGTSGRA